MKNIVVLFILSLSLGFAKVSNDQLLDEIKKNGKAIQANKDEMRASDTKLLQTIAANKAASDQQFALEKQRLDQIDKKLEQVDKKLEQTDRRLAVMEKQIAIMQVEQRNMQKNFEAMQASTNQRFKEMQANTNQRFKEMQENTNNRFDDVNKRFDDLHNTFIVVATIIGAILTALIGIVYSSSKQMNKELKQFFEITAAKLQEQDAKIEHIAIQSQESSKPVKQDQKAKEDTKTSLDDSIKLLVSILAKNDEHIAKQLKQAGLA